MAPEKPIRAPWLGKLLVESLLIVLSILLALAVDSWREGRRNAARAEQALAGFEAEIRRNKAALEAVAPYHVQLLNRLGEQIGKGEIRRFEDFRKLAGFQGLRPAILEATAWRTAMATGTLEHLDYEMAQALSRLYTRQERFTEYTTSSTDLFSPTSLADENIPALVKGITAHLVDVTHGEKALQEAYADVLRRLEARPGRTGPAPPPAR